MWDKQLMIIIHPPQHQQKQMNPSRQQYSAGNLLLGLLASLVVALVLMVVQLPDWLYNFWPDWVALVLIYWALAVPSRIGPFMGFVIGTILEVMLVRKFGVLGLGFAVLAFIANSANQQLRMMTLWQQTLLIALFMLAFKIITGWLYGIVSDFTISREYWFSLLGNMFVWPFLFILMEEIRRALRIR